MRTGFHERLSDGLQNRLGVDPGLRDSLQKRRDGFESVCPAVQRQRRTAGPRDRQLSVSEPRRGVDLLDLCVWDGELVVARPVDAADEDQQSAVGDDTDRPVPRPRTYLVELGPRFETDPVLPVREDELRVLTVVQRRDRRRVLKRAR
ncbi:hypothetical protein ACFQL1_15410 [Halomicroarcula sp. GCM10025709]|uniref:hypothetical protein n=1 Tax=Halomicroarcula sp. GCM10025709 TaxID=3252669 RepID=UPI00360C6559